MQIRRAEGETLISQTHGGRWGVQVPVVVHVLDLPLHVAVDALAVGAVRQLSHHAQSVRPLLPGKELLDGHDDALPAPLSGDAHHLLPQGHLCRSRGSFFGFAPPSL